MWKRISFILAFSLLLCGCLQKKIIDDVNLVMAIGYDAGEDDQIKGTIVAPEFKKEEAVENKNMTIQAHLSRDLIAKLQKESSKPLVYGKLQFALFSEEVAKNGIAKYIDSLERDASVGSRVILAVSRGEAKELLEIKGGQEGTAEYFRQLLNQNMWLENLPIENLQIYLRNYYSEGRDPCLPLLEKKGDHARIIGLALFQNDKMVGEIKNDKLFYFKLLSDTFANGVYTVALEGGREASIQSIHSSRRVKIDEQNPFHITVYLNVEGYIREYSKGSIQPNVIKEVEKTFEKDIVKNSAALVASFKKKKIDPIGFGEEIIIHTGENIHDKTLRKQLDKLRIDVIADVQITETGVVK